METISHIYNRLSPYIKQTPLIYNSRLSKKYNSNIFLKREDLHNIRSFKIRGALNKILKQIEYGNINKTKLVCASAGNHAQGVAYSGKLLNIPTYIYIPKITPNQKINRIKQIGGNNCYIYEYGNTFNECLEKSLEFSNKLNGLFIHPFDDLDVILGQSTVSYEIYNKLSPDIILSPIGGGGLISGLYKHKEFNNLDHLIYGVEPNGADSMKKSLINNSIISIDNIDTFVDGASVNTPGKLTYDICKKNKSKIFSIDNGRLCNELIQLYEEDGIIAEPAGVLSICGLDFIDKSLLKDKKIVCILSGGNNDLSRYPDILDRNKRYLGLKHYFIIQFNQKSGELKKYMLDILPENVDITRFEYIKKNNLGSGSVLIGIELTETYQLDIIKNNMKQYDIDFIEINKNNLLFDYLI